MAEPIMPLSNRSWLEAEAAPPERLIWVVPLATAVAVTANVILFTIITRWFGNDLIVGGAQTELWLLPAGDVVIFSVVFSLVAGFVFAIVSQLARRPIRTYLIIATIALLLSFIPPLTFPSPPVAMVDKLSLVAMHIVGAIAVVGVLVGLGRKH